ncbi:hypothetical protein [Cellulomonas hominis]|uniref:VG15 protein n=1 Tax=Cellulomonas hominis TaxID=156981 RepID=UPI001443B4BF|nr:hypothetical protein [Cellulomonas hominis]NKY08936.1 hypothetical protein [Cellulomonas hominis]
MTTRRDVERLGAASSQVVALARQDLTDFFASLDLNRPEAVRDALVDFVPALVGEYGDAAAAIAADWYEELRATQVGGRFTALAAPGAAGAEVAGSVRWAAGSLFGEDPTQALTLLGGAIQRHILYAGRATVRRNVARDAAHPRYARVPSGSHTCAFCTMLASRGFVYHDEKLAQHRGLGQHQDKFHDNCDCLVVVEFDADAHHIAGYDPDAMYAMYESAADEVGDRTNTEAILATMREQHGLA